MTRLAIKAGAVGLILLMCLVTAQWVFYSASPPRLFQSAGYQADWSSSHAQNTAPQRSTVVTQGSRTADRGSRTANQTNFREGPVQHEQSSWPCVDPLAANNTRTEDIFCLRLPPFLPEYKNPCFYAPTKLGQQVLKCLPYFHILGVGKSGTSDLFARMTAHWQIYNNKAGKEVGFWSWKRYGYTWNVRVKIGARSTVDQYINFFKIAAKDIEDSENGTSLITGDGAPMDIRDFRGWPQIPQNFGKEEPEVLTPHLMQYVFKDRTPKFVVILREPVSRLYSEYVFLKQGKTPETFHQHVLSAIALFNDCLRNHTRRFCFFDEQLHKVAPVRVHAGCYSAYLREWLEVFPLEDFHVLRTEDYHEDTKGQLTQLFAFLQVEPLPDKQLDVIANWKKMHTTKDKKGEPLPHTKKLLREFYDPCVQETATLLQDDRFLWQDIYLKEREEGGG